MNKIERINDFVVRFANVNGSGSASANNLFAKAVFRMGIPVSPKNIFPSNIQGLPTWYEVRISEKGYLGRRESIDFVVAVNGQTLKKDYDTLASGGYFLYDSTRPLPENFARKDINLIPIPLTEMANQAFATPRLRQLLKNIIYIGALSYLLDLEFSVLTGSIEKQFAKKPKLAEPNIKALEMGFTYAKENFGNFCFLTLQRRDNLPKDAILIDGNSALGLGAVYGGATVTGWYPITPSTSVIESFEKYCNAFRIEDGTGKKKVAIIQTEDELAALGVVIGASWNGARAFTATSGPGLSLMSEFLGLAYFAEIPVVLVNVQRAGPSTGMPTRTQQSDILASAFASHGDSKHVLLFPSTPKECFDLGTDAFDLADRLQTPVIILSDLDLGMNDHVSEPFSWDNNRCYDRGKVMTAEMLEEKRDKWGRYLDVDGDGICFRTYPGTHPTKGAYFTRGTSHNEYSGYTEDSKVYQKGMERLLLKWETARSYVPAPEITIADPKSTIGIIHFGTSSYACQEALDMLAEKDIAINGLRIKSFPFHKDIQDFLDQHQRIYVVEQNRDAQMRTLLINDCDVANEKLLSVLNFDGMPITAETIFQSITQSMKTTGENS